MTKPVVALWVVTCVLAVGAMSTLAVGAEAAKPGPGAKETTVTARGTFEVKMAQQPADDGAGGGFGRYFIEKTFHGDLEGTSKGQMLASGGPDKGSGGYVALEQVTGVLGGKHGTFVLQHRGTMTKAGYAIDVTVVPESGTGELAGISGTMKIIIQDGKHSYEFTYAIAGG